MARIIGGLGTSHVPAIGAGIAKGLEQSDFYKPFFDGYAPVHAWLNKAEPDLVVVFYNDHGLNFFLDAMPTFAIGAAATYRNADEGWGLPVAPEFPGSPRLSWRLVESLIEAEFDLTVCQTMLVDHAFAIPMELLWPSRDGAKKIPAIPICINTVQHPLPGAGRCYRLGQAVGQAIRDWDEDLNVLVVGSGGLSHQLDGERAGFLNPEFDRYCLDKLVADPEALTRYSNPELVNLAGTQGVEILMWLAMRGALGGPVRELSRTYHIPISNTAAAVQLLAPLPPSPQLRVA